MLSRLTLAIVLLIGVAASSRAQEVGQHGVSVSGGFGLGGSTERGVVFTVDASADWRPEPLFVSFRLAAASVIFGDETREVGLLVGLTHRSGRWTASAGAGVGLVWLYDAPPWLLASPGDEGDLTGPFLSLPVSGELAVRVYGPFFVRLRGIASMNAGESFAGTSLGWGLWF